MDAEAILKYMAQGAIFAERYTYATVVIVNDKKYFLFSNSVCTLHVELKRPLEYPLYMKAMFVQSGNLGIETSLV